MKMKLIVDISEEIYEHAKERSEDSNDEYNAFRAIEKGKPLDDLLQEIDKWHHLTDKAFNDGIDTALEIIDKHIGDTE